MQHAFKVPTLRNIVERAPYMHDGSARNLCSMVENYDNGFVKRPSLSTEVYELNLTQAEKHDLVEFMKTLSSPDTEMAMPRLPAYDQIVAGSVSGVNTAAGESSAAKGTSKTCGGFLQHWMPCNK